MSFVEDKKVSANAQTFEPFLKDSKGQGAIEYLLIIGGAILIAAVVIAIVASTGKKGKDQANTAQGALNNADTNLNQLTP